MSDDCPRVTLPPSASQGDWKFLRLTEHGALFRCPLLSVGQYEVHGVFPDIPQLRAFVTVTPQFLDDLLDRFDEGAPGGKVPVQIMKWHQPDDWVGDVLDLEVVNGTLYAHCNMLRLGQGGPPGVLSAHVSLNYPEDPEEPDKVGPRLACAIYIPGPNPPPSAAAYYGGD